MPAALQPQTPARRPRFTLPRRKKRTSRPRPDRCLNCGRGVDDNFCARCGQENKDHTVALSPLLSDLLAEVISWDSKLVQTLIPLIVRPGFLTNEYNAGRRIGYLSPLKLYLTVSVLFFLALSWKAPLNRQYIVIEPSGITFGAGHHRSLAPASSTVAEYDARQSTLPPSRRDPPLARRLIHHLYQVRQSPQAFISALLGDIPKMMFFLLPLFAVSLKVLYLRTGRLYVEHLVFLLHLHAFAFLILTPLLLAPLVWRISCASLVLAVYAITALRVAYKQSWPKTLVKFSLLGFGYVMLLVACFMGTTLAALWLM